MKEWIGHSNSNLITVFFFFYQADEIEALSSIYGDEWCIVDDEHRIYCIQVNDGQEKPVWSLSFQVSIVELELLLYQKPKIQH